MVDKLLKKIDKNSLNINLRDEKKTVNDFSNSFISQFIQDQLMNTRNVEEKYQRMNQEVLYNELLNVQKPGTKWNELTTNKYLEETENLWPK